MGSKRKREFELDEVSKGAARARQFLEAFADLPLETMDKMQALQEIRKLKDDLENDAKNCCWLQQFLKLSWTMVGLLMNFVQPVAVHDLLECPMGSWMDNFCTVLGYFTIRFFDKSMTSQTLFAARLHMVISKHSSPCYVYLKEPDSKYL